MLLFAVLRHDATAQEHIAGGGEIERLSALVEDARIDPVLLKPQPRLVLNNGTGSDALGIAAAGRTGWKKTSLE